MTAIQALPNPVVPTQTTVLARVPQTPPAPITNSTPQVDTLTTTNIKGIPAVLPLLSTQETLPPIEVEQRGNTTYYRNAFGLQITSFQYPQGSYSMMFSKDSLAMMVRQHDDKRDTLNFSDMNSNIQHNSKIPNVYFHIEGKAASQIRFNEKHQPVITLTNGETLTFDRSDGQTLVEGPFNIKFYPDEMGQNFDVIYTGSDKLKRFKSKGDKIVW